jgi:hypothetical protein
LSTSVGRIDLEDALKAHPLLRRVIQHRREPQPRLFIRVVKLDGALKEGTCFSPLACFGRRDPLLKYLLGFHIQCSLLSLRVFVAHSHRERG